MTNYFGKVVSFYEEYHETHDLRAQYLSITTSGDGWTPIAKMGKIIEFIKTWHDCLCDKLRTAWANKEILSKNARKLYILTFLITALCAFVF